MKLRRVAVIGVCVVVLGAGGVLAAVTLANGDPQTACAVASVPEHTIGVDTTPVFTVPGASDTQCVTVTAETVTLPGETVTTPGETVTETTTTTETVTVTVPVTVTQPTTTVTPPPDPKDFSFPVNPGPVGSSLPGRACGDPSPAADCTGDAGFDRSDYEGWSTGANGRMFWVLDPAGSGKTVVRFDVRGSDSADQYGGTRTSLWRTADNLTGSTVWQAFGVYLPVGFTWPDSWFLLYQDFSSGGNPAQALELMGAGCVSSAPRNHFCWKDQTAPSSGLHYTDLGLAQPGHWFYVAEQIKFLNTAGGFDRVWQSSDTLPDVSGSPTVDWSGVTAYTTAANRSNILLYRNTSTQNLSVFYCGFHRASDQAALILPNC